jgi:hypothetical protein
LGTTTGRLKEHHHLSKAPGQSGTGIATPRRVSDAAIVGLLHETLDEVPVAAVVPDPTALARSN